MTELKYGQTAYKTDKKSKDIKKQQQGKFKRLGKQMISIILKQFWHE